MSPVIAGTLMPDKVPAKSRVIGVVFAGPPPPATVAPEPEPLTAVCTAVAVAAAVAFQAIGAVVQETLVSGLTPDSRKVPAVGAPPMVMVARSLATPNSPKTWPLGYVPV